LWYAEEGDQLYQGDHLAELVVSGAVVDVDAPVDGILVERLAGPEECLQVGQVLARIETQLGWH
jgi:2-oxoglutarate dehydrogenase E2 component (dihydrolipoamide succinyltransferase)/2-oxoisovalerate dehydrogenase E2 component (dihydrolipoyl transacylase)